MNRRFRLSALERLRGSTLADAARALGLARREVAAADADRTEVQRALQNCDSGGAQSAPFAAHSAASRRERLREDLRRAGDRVGMAQSQELAAVAGWHSARSDLRAVEALHERHRLSLIEADARAEQRTLDELAAVVRRPWPDLDGDRPGGEHR
jgi:flagellar biosynthesis chaperone FliJ